MNRPVPWIVAGIAVLFLAAFLLWPKPKPPTAPPVANVYDTIDRFQEELANRTRQKLGASDDFQVIVAQIPYPIGTLMRQGTTIPVDYRACAPGAQPPHLPVPSLFPNYNLSNATAVTFGIDSEALSDVGKAGIDLARNEVVILSFRDTGADILSDRDIKDLIGLKDCRAAIASEPVWLVRGYIDGRRTFTLRRSAGARGELSVAKVGSFDVTPVSGGASVGLTDDSDLRFLQIVSQVALPPPELPVKLAIPITPGHHPLERPGPIPPPSVSATPAPAVTKPTQQAAAGHVFVQIDIADSSGTAAQVVANLRTAGFPVVAKVERVDSAKMPRRAQIRYFNVADLPVARRALAQLTPLFPDAALVRIALPSPPGQLEVWLPKAGG